MSGKHSNSYDTAKPKFPLGVVWRCRHSKQCRRAGAMGGLEEGMIRTQPFLVTF